MRPICRTISVTLGFCLLALRALGDFYPQVMLDPQVTKFLNEGLEFSGDLELLLNYENGKPDRWPVHIAVAGGLTRVEMDITQLETPNPVDLENYSQKQYYTDMKKAGAAESVAIFNPRRKCAFTILPKLKIYVENPIPKDQLAELKKRPKATKVELGTESVDGRPCTKTKLIFDKETMDVWRTWENPEAIIWEAKDSPGVPLRMVVRDSEGYTNATFIFKSVELKKPAMELFEPPKGFTQCDMQSMLERIRDKWPKDK